MINDISGQISGFNIELFSKLMRIHKTSTGVTLRDGAKLIGISAPTFCRIIRKKAPGEPDLNTFYLCCKWMEAPVEIFFPKQ